MEEGYDEVKVSEETKGAFREALDTVTKEVNIEESIKPRIDRIVYLDEQISRLNYEIKDFKSERAIASDALVEELQGQGVETSVGLKSGELVKLDTKVHPKVVDMDGFHAWAEEQGVTLPVMTFMPQTLAAWFKEQLANSAAIPSEEILSKFIKTTIKVNKSKLK